MCVTQLFFGALKKSQGGESDLLQTSWGVSLEGIIFVLASHRKQVKQFSGATSQWAEKEGKENQGVLLGTPRNDNNSAWVNPKKDGSSFDEATYFQPGSWRNFPQENGRKQSNSGWKMGFWSKTHTFPDIGDQWIAWHGDIFIFAFIDSAEKAE